MALSRLNYNSLNVTPVASKGIGFDSGADDLSTDFSGGAIRFIKKLTASSSDTLSFVDGSASVVLDDTYKEYMFIFNNIHPETDGQQFRFQTSIDTGSNYNVTITSTYFLAYHKEDGTEAAGPSYITGSDQAQTTNFMVLGSGDAENDSGISGYMHLYNPSSTTFVKHFMARTINDPSGYAQDEFTAGYFNDTNDIDAVQFKFASGDIDAGTISLYGIN